MNALALLALLSVLASAQSFEAWSAKAEKAQKNGDAAAAIELWGDALRLWRPTDGKARRAKALASRAALFERSGQPDLALRDLDEAVKNDAKSPRLFDQRGALHLSQGRAAEAMSDFYSATKLDVRYGPAYLHRAQAYELQGEALFASEDYKTACKLGVAEACGKGRAPEPAKKAPLGKDVSGGKPQPPAALGPKKAKAARAFTPSVPACRAALEACRDRGNGLDRCVEKTADCADKPRAGCCPRDCLDAYRRMEASDVSEAEAFRSVFGPGGTCEKAVPPLR